ncbi:MAG: TetR/AcrR family transcriptional regulator [Ilumatobacteraceae bacterium]
MTAPRSRRKRGTGQELRDVIVRVATDLLAQVGDVGALKMRAVAEAAGVTAPSVYRHFPNKQDLVRTIIAERFDEFTSVLTSAAEAAGDEPLSRLEAVAAAYVRSGLEHPGHYRVLFSAMNAGPAGLGLDDGTEHPGVASHRVLIDAVVACLPAADRADKTFVLATELWASLHGIVDLRITKRDMPWPEPDALLDIAMTAMRAAAAPGPESRAKPKVKPQRKVQR